MKRFRPEWRRTLVHPISQLITQAVDGLSGKSRRRLHSLEMTLMALQAERDRLRSEIRELVQYTDVEIANLKEAADHYRQERDELQMRVWALEEELEELASHLEVELAAPKELEASTIPAFVAMDTPEKVMVDSAPPETGDVTSSAALPSLLPIDLSSLRLAIVGGHPSTRRGVIQELRNQHGLKYWVEIPRITESNTNRTRVKAKICRCNLVVLITGYMSHRLTEIVFSLKDAGSLAGEVLQLNCRGKSGVVREILNHVNQAGSSL